MTGLPGPSNRDPRNAARTRRFSYTTRARTVLAFSFVLIPAMVLSHVALAVGFTAKYFVTSCRDLLADDFRWWYRHVYRPAIYGSVHDADA